MKVNARTDKFQHLEVFDKPALFTNGRIARDTVPEGWYCYDIRGSDDDPGELCYMEENVVVNHAGSVLMPEKLAMPKSGRLDVRDELGFLDEGNMTLREFCEAHQIPYPAENMKFHIRPARPEEAGLFYTPHPEEDKRLGTVGHVRMDFGRSGNEFWHTWWPRGPEELNSPAFKAELQQVVDTLRESVLKNRFAMERFCYEHGGKISGGWTQNYGYIVETEHYRYCLRCNPSSGDYNCYCTAYDLTVQRQNMARDKPLVGRVTYANGDAQEFTDADEFLRCVQEELPYRPTTGFRYEVLTDDPVVRKQVDDITSAGHLSAQNFSFGEEIIESDGKLNFYLQADFDVDAAFGTFVCTDQNDDWLNIYANYDVEQDRLCDTLELNLCKGDGSEESWSYPLNAAEQEVLLRKMEAFCQQQTGMSLHEYAQQLRDSESQTPGMQM